MAALFQVGKYREGIRCTSCSGHCTSQLDSQLNGKRRTRTRNISDIVLCIRYLRTLRRSLVRFLIQNNECVNTVQGTFHVVLCLLHTYRDIQHFARFLFQIFQILKLPKYAASHREMTKKRRFVKITIWARI